jgi:periplasmic divalent cation tolerance protein
MTHSNITPAEEMFLRQLPDLVEVTTTVGTEADAKRLAVELVTKRIAACVQITGPIESVYEWDGITQIGPEFGLKLKVAPQSIESAVDYLNANHPYELPEIILHPVKCSQNYADWVNKQRLEKRT